MDKLNLIWLFIPAILITPADNTSFNRTISFEPYAMNMVEWMNIHDALNKKY
jgi:hypothetical protein